MGLTSYKSLSDFFLLLTFFTNSTYFRVELIKGFRGLASLLGLRSL